MKYLLILCVIATFAPGQSSLRVAPAGTTLENGLVTPIYLDLYRAPEEETRGDPRDLGKSQAYLRLKDAQGVRVELYVKRGTAVDLDGTKTPTLQLFLNRPDGATGSREIEAQSTEERAYLKTLRVAEENYTPGWTQNWSIEHHREVQKLIADLIARNP